MRQITKEFLLALLKNSEEDLNQLLEKRRDLFKNSITCFEFSYPERIELQTSVSNMMSDKVKLTECIEEISKL